MTTETVIEDVITDLRSGFVGDYYHEEYTQALHYPLVMLTLMHAAGWKETDYETLVIEAGYGLSFGYKIALKFAR